MKSFTTNEPNLLNKEKHGRSVKFVCVKGGGNDWTMYSGPGFWPSEMVAKQGDKVYDEATIRFVSDCDNEMFKLYRF